MLERAQGLMRILQRPLTPIGPNQTEGLLRLCAADPVGGTCLASQLMRWRTWSTGDVVVLGHTARPDGGAWTAGSLMPFGLGPRAGTGHRGATAHQVRALADHYRRRVAPRGSVFGPVEDVEPVWQALADQGMACRQERWNQPLLAAPHVAGGLAPQIVRRRPALEWVARRLRTATPLEEDLVLPASVAMFTDELGYDPTSSGQGYARHVSWLISSDRSYIVLDDGQGGPSAASGPRAVAFKADVGSLWPVVPGLGRGVAQLTGVWTRPDLRGRGVGAVALAAVVDAVRREHLGKFYPQTQGRQK